MKKIFSILTLAVVGCMFTACETEQEAMDLQEIQKPYTYSDLYYQNLRDYKATDHSIAFGWYAQYGDKLNPSNRFSSLPDSMDIISLWGGIPNKDATDVWEDLRFTQKVKGTKMLSVAITHIEDNTYEDVMAAIKEARAANDPDMINAAIEMYAMKICDEVFDNDLDGFDADYEPNGDFLQNKYMTYFLKVLNKYMGPYNPISDEEGAPMQTPEDRLKLIQARYGADKTLEDCKKLLCVDYPGNGGSDASKWHSLCNYYFYQTYSGSNMGGGTNNNGWPWEKVVLCTNMGDNYITDMSGMYTEARFQPATGRKGGFGMFYMHRDLIVNQYNPTPYHRTRECIQIQNPAVH